MTNAIKFIQQHGVEKAREVVKGAPEGASAFNMVSGSIIYYQLCDNWWWFNSAKKEYEMDYSKSMRISLSDLKRVVESLDIIKELGGLESAKANLFEMYDDSSCDWVHEKARLYDYKHLTVGRVKQAIADYEAIYSGAGS